MAGGGGRVQAGPAVGDDELAGVTTRAEFGSLLTALRTRSGLSLRELATRLNSSPSTLSGWCRAENLPFPSQHNVFGSMLEELGVTDPEPWIDALIRIRDNTSPRSRDEITPYRGLEGFTEQDARWFYGRSDLIDRAHEAASDLAQRHDRPRVLVIVGASGSGKSSLMRAGLQPRLEEEGSICRALSPGPAPLERLARVLADEPDLELLDGLRDDPPAWVGAAHVDADLDDLVILVDQFEELFTVCDDEQERDRFLAMLETLADPRLMGYLVVISLRIDLYAEVAATGRLAGPLEQSQILVGPMDRDQLVDVIVEPARQAGWSVDDDLVTVLLRDFLPAGALGGRHQSGALPMLSYALLETWQRARRGRMTIADYHAIGGIHGAIEQAAEQAYSGLTPEQQTLARDVLLRLVRLSDDDALATRRAANFHELEGLARLGGSDEASADAEAGRRSDVVTAVVGRFVDARLLTVQEATIELAHEALLAAWPRLAAWIEEDRDALRVRRTIAEATRLWLDSDRDPSTLASGVRLAAMRSASGTFSRPLLLSQVEREFIDTSIEAAEAAEVTARQRTRRLRILVAVATVSALLAGGLAVSASAARTAAITARDDALSRQIALTADRLRTTHPALAAQLAVVAHAIAPTGEASSTLVDTATAPRPERYVGGAGTTAAVVSADGAITAVSDASEAAVQLFHSSAKGLSRAGRIQLDADAEIYALAMSPAEQLLAVGDTTASIHLWDVTDPDLPVAVAGPLQGPAGPIQGLAFDPAGAEIAAVGLGDGVFRWDTRDPAAPTPLPLLPSAVITWSVAYDPNGGALAVGTDVGEVVLWDLGGDPQVSTTLDAGERPIFSVAYASDGEQLAAGSQDGQLRAWRLAPSGDATPIELEEPVFGSWVNAVAFTPDGAYLAAGSSDTEVRLWDTTNWSPVQTLAHPAAITDIRFADDGATMLTGATDGSARRWDLAQSLPIRIQGAVWGIASDQRGERFAAFSGPETAVWSVDGATGSVTLVDRLPSPPDGPTFAASGAMSPDGRLLAVGTRTGQVWLAELDPAGSATLLEPPLERSADLIEDLDFSPDGTLLAAAGRDSDIYLWDVADPLRPEHVATVDAPDEIVLSVAFSPSAPLLAAASSDNHAYVIDVSDPRAPVVQARLDGFDSDVYTVAFHPDGVTLAAAGSDAEVLLWDVTDPAEPRAIGTPITGPSGRIFDLSFDPTGDLLAAAVVDGTTWVWDTSEPARPTRHRMLDPQAGQAFAALFSPDGRLLFGSGARGHLWAWPTDERRAIDAICATVGDPITVEEWARYLPDRPYDPPCR